MVGRLDKATTGLVLLTTDGRLVNALLRSEYAHAKRYSVTVDSPLRGADVAHLARGVIITTEAQRSASLRRKVLTAATLPCRVDQVRSISMMAVSPLRVH